MDALLRSCKKSEIFVAKNIKCIDIVRYINHLAIFDSVSYSSRIISMSFNLMTPRFGKKTRGNVDEKFFCGVINRHQKQRVDLSKTQGDRRNVVRRCGRQKQNGGRRRPPTTRH